MADSSYVKEITSKLEQGVKDLFNSDAYSDYLRTMSRFHQYSTRNTLLIHIQKPNATLVSGFHSWINKFERHVNKGEKAIKILAPVPFTKREEKEKLDPDTQKPIIGEDGMPVVEVTEQRFIAKFNIVNVYDVSQTSGKPLPSLVQNLTGNVEQYEAFIDALRAVSPLPIVFEPMEEGHDGTCHFGDRIAIREGMSEVQTVCAVIHELTHAKLHDIAALRLADENAAPKDRSTEELEAESVSYSVCSYYNIETGANSFGYIAEWSKERELKELNASLDTIRKTAAELIDAIDDKFQEIVKDRNITFAIGEQQADLTEPIQTANDSPPVPETAAPVDRPRAGAVYAQYCNRISDAVTLDEAYGNAVLNSDEQNARLECESAIRRVVLRLFSESAVDHTELYRQYADNPDFKGRLEDYVFMRTYLEPRTAQRNSVKEPPKLNIDVSAIMATYTRNAEVSNPHRVGSAVLMTPVFDDGNFNRNGKKIRVTVEQPAGKYQLFSRDENGDKKFYFLTASGRIDNTAGYFRSEWDEKQRKRVYLKPTEAELDGLLPMIDERFQRDMADPAKWALYQHAAVLNRLDECEAHNTPIRELRNAEDSRRREAAERGRQEEQQKKLEKYNTRVDEIAKAIEKGETIDVTYNEYEFDGRNPVLDLFKLYDIALPLRTQGWVNTGLAEIAESGYRYYSGKHKGNSTAFSGYLLKLRQAIKEVPIEQKRENVTNSEVAVKEAIKTVENNLYEKFAELFPQFMSGEYSTLRLEAEHAKPLTLEWVFGNMISISHNYEIDGKAAYDPMITLGVNSVEKTLSANMFELSDPPRIDVVHDDKGRANIGMQDNINSFMSQWLEKIEKQGFKAVSATIELDNNGNVSKEGLITDKTVQITFDENANLTMSQQEENYQIYYWDTGMEIEAIHYYNEDDDYDTLAYISYDRSVEFSETDLSDEIRAIINFYAKTAKIPNAVADITEQEASDFNMKPLTHEQPGYKEWSEPATPENALKKPEKQYKLGFGFLGNGVTVWNRAGKHNNDYVTVAHIERDRTVIYYDSDMPDAVKARIENAARIIQDPALVPLPKTSVEINLEQYANDFVEFMTAHNRLEGLRPFTLQPESEKRSVIADIKAGQTKDDKNLLYGISLNEDYKEEAQSLLQRLEQLEILVLEKSSVPLHANLIQAENTSDMPSKIVLNIPPPDPTINIAEMNQYGYMQDNMHPLSEAKALEIFDSYNTVYLLNSDNTDSMPDDRNDIIEFIKNGGLCGITSSDWEDAFISGLNKPQAAYITDSREIETANLSQKDESDLNSESEIMPDPTIGFSEMNLYGYAGGDMLPLTKERAAELFDTDHCVYLLYSDNTEAMALDRDEIINHDGLCGIENADWERSPVRAAQLAIAVNSEGNREADLLFGDGNKFGIYQIRDSIDESHNFRFASMRELEALGLTVDRRNYELVYTAPLTVRDTQSNLHKILKEFNEDERPADYVGHSVAVSDVIVLQCRGEISSHFVDSAGFVKLDAFLGEEMQNTPVAETLSQVGTRSEEYNGASVADFEADVKAGKTISLLDFSKAIKAENDNKNRPSATKSKPTLMERLEEGRRKAAQNGQPDAQKNKER